MMSGMMAGMGLWAILVLAALLAVLLLSVLASITLWQRLRPTHTPPHSATGESARDVLDRRYAAGEIDDEDYERRLTALNQH